MHHSTPPIGGIASASEAGFRILGEETLYSRYKRITERRVGFPDGKEVSFDVLGKPNSRSVFVFPLSPDGKTVTMLREYAPGPHQIMYGFPAGFVEDQVVNRTGAQMGDLSVNRDLEENQVVGGPVGSPNGISDISKRVGPKHSSLEDAALAELSEEARLVCDELVPLSGKQGIMADKYSQGSVCCAFVRSIFGMDTGTPASEILMTNFCFVCFPVYFLRARLRLVSLLPGEKLQT